MSVVLSLRKIRLKEYNMSVRDQDPNMKRGTQCQKASQTRSGVYKEVEEAFAHHTFCSNLN